MESIENKSVGEKELLKLMSLGKVPHGVVLESQLSSKLEDYANKLATWAVCSAEYSNRPCTACKNCIKANTHNHSDIYTAKLSGKTEVIAVEEIRNICNDAYIIPNEADVKVYILPGADKMQPAAQNAFLKILEEPPQNILFVLLCNSAEKLLSTIRSRTVTFSLDILEQTNNNDERAIRAKEIAENIAKELVNSKGYGLMVQTGKITDRAFAKIVLDDFTAIIREAMVAKSGGKIMCCETSDLLRRKIKTINLIKLLEIIQDAQYKLERNINMNLFSTWLCSSLRRQK